MVLPCGGSVANRKSTSPMPTQRMGPLTFELTIVVASDCTRKYTNKDYVEVASPHVIVHGN